MSPTHSRAGAIMPRFVTAGGGNAYRDAVLADSPLAYYRLGETSGTTAVDSVAARNGTYTGTQYTLGQATAVTGGDGSVRLTGTPNTGPSGYVNVPTAAWMNTTALTYEAWVQPTGLVSSTGGGGIVTRWLNGAGSTSIGLLWFNTSNRIAAQFVIGGSTKSAAWATTVTAATWYHTAAVYDGSHVILYVNGSAVASTAATGTLATGTCDLQIGAYKDGQWCLPNHLVDEVAIYGTALSATRLAAHYAAA